MKFHNDEMEEGEEMPDLNLHITKFWTPSGVLGFWGFGVLVLLLLLVVLNLF
jgi:hypothetical protein